MGCHCLEITRTRSSCYGQLRRVWRILFRVLRPPLAYRPATSDTLVDNVVWFSPGSYRVSLPRWRFILGRRAGEMQKASLGSRICINSQGVVILPINVKPPRNVHAGGSTVSLALIGGGLIFGQIPSVCDSTTLCIERHIHVITFIRHRHAPSPIFGNYRYPIASEIRRGSRPWRGWGLGIIPGLSN